MTTRLLVCQTCGRELVPLGDVRTSLQDLGVMALRGSVALESRRLVVPDVVYFSLRDLARQLPALAAQLACHVGNCAANRPSPAVSDAANAPRKEGNPA